MRQELRSDLARHSIVKPAGLLQAGALIALHPVEEVAAGALDAMGGALTTRWADLMAK